MADFKYFDIKFPFELDQKGKFLKLTQSPKETIKSKLMLFITTNRGERLRKPNYGTSLMNYMFEPMTTQTYNDIRNDLVNSIKKYFSEITVTKVQLEANENEQLLGITIEYQINQGVFNETDQLSLLF